MVLTQEAIQAQLERLKQKRNDKGYMSPRDYKEFLPETLGYNPRDMSIHQDILQNIANKGVQATNLVSVMAQNTRDKAEMERRQRELKHAQKVLQQTQNNQPKPAHFNPNQDSFPSQVQSFGNYEGKRNFAKRWGRDNTPEVSDLARLRPNAGIETINYRGLRFSVNRQVAPIFVAFLDDLWATGYRPVSIGGYNDRNIAGTNTKSLHAYGFAIDIDPTLNPVTYGQPITALPPSVGALAAKYGLAWGGAWQGQKKDTMHFSVPYGGTK